MKDDKFAVDQTATGTTQKPPPRAVAKLFVELPIEVKRRLDQAALDRGMTLKDLVSEILDTYLIERGYKGS